MYGVLFAIRVCAGKIGNTYMCAPSKQCMEKAPSKTYINSQAENRALHMCGFTYVFLMYRIAGVQLRGDHNL